MKATWAIFNGYLHFSCQARSFSEDSNYGIATAPQALSFHAGTTRRAMRNFVSLS